MKLRALVEGLEMEAEKGSTPLEEGSVQSKMCQIQNLCGQMLGLRENFGDSVLVVEGNGAGNGGEIDIASVKASSYNAELNRIFSPVPNEFGLEGVENEEEPLMGVAVVEENGFRIDSSVTNVEKKITVKQLDDVSNNGDGPRMEELLSVKSIEEMGVEKVVAAVEGIAEVGFENVVQKEEVEKANDDTELSEVDCSRKLEVSGDGISLFVEFCCPSGGVSQAGEGNSGDKQVLRDGIAEGENIFERNEEGNAEVSEINDSAPDLNNNGFMDEKENGLNKVVGECLGNKESTFVVGDVVWAKTKKNQLWWPGVITDPSNALKGHADSNEKDSFLVKYFGNANFAQYSSSQLKHFSEDLDKMYRQNDSRNFHGAVERAIYEFGQRVKGNMTCSCFSRESQRSSVLFADGSVNWYSCLEKKMGKSCAFSVSQFHPASFLSVIKCIAKSTYLPDKIKLVTTQNCLSAVYSSLGHCQLPMRQLRPHDTKDTAHTNRSCTIGAAVFDDCGFTSSKVAQLSPLRSPKPTEGDLINGEDGGQVDRSKNGYKSRERRKNKCLSYPFVDLKKDHGNAPNSGEKELEDLKGNSSSNGGKKSLKSGSRKSSFRKSSSGFDILGEVKDISSSSAEILSELHLTALDYLYASGQNYSGSIMSFLCGFRRFAFLNIEVANGHIRDLNEGMAISSNYHSAGQTSSSSKPKKRQEKKESKASVSTVVSGVIGNASNGVGSPSLKTEKVSMKRKKAGIDSGIAENKTATRLPDLNRNISASSLEDNQVTESTAFHHELEFGLGSSRPQTAGLQDPGRSKFKFVQLLKDVQSPDFLNSIYQQNYLKGEIAFASEVMDRQLEANENYVQFGSLTSNMQPMSPVAESECRKRKRKEKKSITLNFTVPSPVPDLNGNVAECVSPGVNTPDMNSAPPQVKPPQKRRRNKFTAAVPDVNSNQNKAQKNFGISTPPFTLAKSQLPDGFKTGAMPAPQSTPQNGYPPDLLFIRKNIEMMTSTLEKAGNSLSAEMRTKLESEIAGFMKKISAMVGSSSS